MINNNLKKYYLRGDARHGYVDKIDTSFCCHSLSKHSLSCTGWTKEQYSLAWLKQTYTAGPFKVISCRIIYILKITVMLFTSWYSRNYRVSIWISICIHTFHLTLQENSCGVLLNLKIPCTPLQKIRNITHTPPQHQKFPVFSELCETTLLHNTYPLGREQVTSHMNYTSNNRGLVLGGVCVIFFGLCSIIH